MTKSEIQIRYADYFGLIGGLYSPQSVEMIADAVAMADKSLDGLCRYDSTPLLDHSVATAAIVAGEIGLGRNSSIAAILHDAARLGLLNLSEVNTRFGEAPVGIILGMNDISSIRTNADEDQSGNFRDLIISYSSDPRVILLKLADRLEVMRRLEMFPADKRLKKSWESMNLYAQIAHKLGLYNIKSELEDLAFRYIEPVAYDEISRKLAENENLREELIAKVLAPITRRLDETGIKYHTKSRTKSVYSVWRKMQRQGVPFEEIFDIFAVRIIIDCPAEQEKMLCWSTFSIITDFYTPNPERMRDWISIPKSNGYESLHTTVWAFDHWVEIQIRSERMDEVAERGIAAHWRYKGVKGGGISHEEWLARLRELMEESVDKSAVVKKFDTRLSSNEVFVFTPKGDLRKLPEGATVLDFAFDIHSSVGCACVGAKVNDRNVSIREPLHNGDIVSVLTSKSQRPKADWLNIVVTSKAKNRIRIHLREEEAKLASLGREELERKLKNWKLSITLDDAVAVLCRYYKIKTGIEIYGRIVEQKLDLTDVKEVIQRHLAGDVDAPIVPKSRTEQKKEHEVESSEALVLGEGVHGLGYKFARCCNPIFGDDVFGFITVGGGTTIHRNDCPNAKRLREMYPYRIMAARWKGSTGSGSFLASIRVVAEDSTGMLNRLTESIGALGVNIRSMSIAPMRDNLIAGAINIEVSSSSSADMVAFNLLKIGGVRKAYRVK